MTPIYTHNRFLYEIAVKVIFVCCFIREDDKDMLKLGGSDSMISYGCKPIYIPLLIVYFANRRSLLN